MKVKKHSYIQQHIKPQLLNTYLSTREWRALSLRRPSVQKALWQTLMEKSRSELSDIQHS